MKSHWSKIKKTLQVAGAYAVVAWVLIQVVATISEPLNLPDWADTLTIVILAIGFPITLIMCWAFNSTPDGHVADDRAKKDSKYAEAALEAVNKPSSTQNDQRQSIAVLPFVDMSPQRDQEYFSDGLSEELLNVLAQLKDLRVISRTSSFAFKGQNQDVRKVGEVLDVTHVLEGSVRKAGEALRITAQLIDVSNASHLWSQTFDRNLDDVFAIQDEIATAVADELSVKLGISMATASKGLTEDVESYEYYLRARALFDRNGKEDLLRAAEFYNQALDRDGNFSRARAGLVLTLVFSAIYVPERRMDLEQALSQVIQKAENESPDDWATHLARAALHLEQYEWKAAEDALIRAADKAPGSVSEINQTKMFLYLNLGRVEDCVTMLDKARADDPLSANVSFFSMFGNWFLGRLDKAEEHYRHGQSLPGSDNREDIPHVAFLQIWNEGDTALIEKRFDTYLERSTVPTRWIKDVRTVYNDPEQALKIIRSAFDDPATQDPTRMAFLAYYACHYGDTELAFKALRSSLIDHRAITTHILWWPDLACIRNLPDFKNLVREIGLADYWQTTGNWGNFSRPLGENDFELYK